MDVLKQGRVARKGSADGMGGGAAADYASVEQDPFIVDDDDLDDRLDDELDSGIKGRDLEMR